MNNICQRSIIKCKFESIGCDASMARNLLNNHLKHGMDNHMILLLEENKKLKEELQTLKVYMLLKCSFVLLMDIDQFFMSSQHSKKLLV